MYEPCEECYLRYGRIYSGWCDDNCAYGVAVKKYEIAVQQFGECVCSMRERRQMIKDINAQLDDMIRKLEKED